MKLIHGNRNGLNFTTILIIFTFCIISLYYLSYISLYINSPFQNKQSQLRINEQSEDAFESKMEKICKKSSKNLQTYYETYNPNLTEVSEIELLDYEYYPDSIKSLLNIIIGEGEITDNIIDYFKSISSAYAFLLLALMSIVGWIFFGCFSCCNCCCCCCCKKTECKCTILFLKILFDIITILSCLLGFFYTDKMYKGISNVECSMMKFISEISKGENRSNETSWIGFDGIVNIFDRIKNEINQIKTNTQTQLDNNYNTLQTKKENFPGVIQGTYNELLDPDEEDSPTIFNPIYLLELIQENTMDAIDIGVLDLMYNYGPMNEEGKFLYELMEQYNVATEKADDYLNSAHNSFQNLLNGNDLENLIDTSKNNVEEISSSINDIKDNIVDLIINYMDIFETYGKAIIILFYIIISSACVLSSVFLITMYCIYVEKCENRCCCAKGFVRTITHFLWNITNIIVILSFIFASIILLISHLGTDMVKVLSIILGEKNLYSPTPILIEGDVKNYFDVCFHGDGDLATVLGLIGNDSSTNEFDELNKLMDKISEAKNLLQENEVVIKLYKENLEKRKNLKEVNIYDFELDKLINLDEQIIKFNALIKEDEFDVWTLNNTCPDGGYTLVHPPPTVTRKNVEDEPVPKECLNFKEWENDYTVRYRSPPILILHEVYSTVLKASNFYVKLVNGFTDYINSGTVTSILTDKVGIVEDTYNDVISTELSALDIYNDTISSLVSIFYELNNGTDSLFSFLNCNFFRDNVLILFKYLNNTFGTNMKILGASYAINSFCLLFSISFTILEIVVIDASSYYERRRREKEEQIVQSLGAAKVINYVETNDNEIESKREKTTKI